MKKKILIEYDSHLLSGWFVYGKLRNVLVLQNKNCAGDYTVTEK